LWKTLPGAISNTRARALARAKAQIDDHFETKFGLRANQRQNKNASDFGGIIVASSTKEAMGSLK